MTDTVSVTPSPLALLLLGRGADPESERGVECPGDLPAAVRPRPGGAGPRGQGGARRPGVRARPPLPARRGHPVRRRHRRLVQAGARRGGPARRGVHRVLRRALHGRERRHPHLRRAAGRPARPRGRLLDGRHGRDRAGRGRLGRAGRRRRRRRHGPGHVHELLRRHQGVHRAPRRHGLHLVQRRAGAAVGLRAGRAGALPARPAPGPQHRGAASSGSRSTTACVFDPHKPGGGAHARAAARREDDPVARPLLGARPVHRRQPSHDVRERVPGVNVLVHPECRHEVVTRGRPGRLDRVHHHGPSTRRRPGRRGRSAPSSTWSGGWPLRTRTSRSCSWTRPSATARR